MSEGTRRLIGHQKDAPIRESIPSFGFVPLLIEPTAQTECVWQLTALGLNQLVHNLLKGNAAILNYTDVKNIPSISWEQRGPVDTTIFTYSSGLYATARRGTVYEIAKPQYQSPYDVSFDLATCAAIRKPNGKPENTRDPNEWLIRKLFGPQIANFDISENSFSLLGSTIIVPFLPYNSDPQVVKLYRMLNTVAATLHYNVLDRSLSDGEFGRLLGSMQAILDKIPDDPNRPENRLAITLAYQGLVQLATLRTHQPHYLEQGFYEAYNKNGPKIQISPIQGHVSIMKPQKQQLPYNKSQAWIKALAERLVIEGIAPDKQTALIAARSTMGL